MKYQVYIWGAGHCLQQIAEEIDDTKVDILGILDNDTRKQGQKLFSFIPIISPQNIQKKDFDYLLISVKNYGEILDECRKLGIPEEKIVVYWNRGENIFKRRAERIEQLMNEKKQLEIRLDSAPYEWGIMQVPKIKNGVELLKKINKDYSSLCRFGDGEFEIIRGKERPWFQKPDRSLSARLKEVLFSNDGRINIAIAQNFVDLDQYKEKAAQDIREYMFGNTRKYILDLLDKKRIYYDTYVTRPYIIYKDKKNADQIFPLFKKVWKERDVVIIEGEYSRIGIDNNLMEQAHSVARILCPSQNAWDKYDQILNTVLKKVSKKSLLCISLGPCATVLAYDLAKEDYQALDIGQLDNEYEWYLREAQERMEIPGKMVAELAVKQRLGILDNKEYMSQIVAKII